MNKAVHLALIISVISSSCVVDTALQQDTKIYGCWEYGDSVLQDFYSIHEFNGKYYEKFQLYREDSAVFYAVNNLGCKDGIIRIHGIKVVYDKSDLNTDKINLYNGKVIARGVSFMSKCTRPVSASYANDFEEIIYDSLSYKIDGDSLELEGPFQLNIYQEKWLQVDTINAKKIYRKCK